MDDVEAFDNRRALAEKDEELDRLWDALAWLASYDPMSVDEMEGEFGFHVHNRTVAALNPRDRKVKRGVRV